MNSKEASELIEAALSQAITSNEDHAEGDILVDWVVVAHVANPDKEKGGAYPMFVSNGEMPMYRLVGLLQIHLMGLQNSDDDLDED